MLSISQKLSALFPQGLPLDQWLPAAVLAGLAVLSFILRKPIGRAILYLTLSHSRRHFEEDYKAMRKEILEPLKGFIPTAFLTAACHLANFIPAPWQAFLVKLADTALTALAFWLLFKTAMVIGVIVLRRKREAEQPIGAGATLLVSMIRVTLIFIGVFVILSYWVKNVAGLITGLGIGGLAITLAAQNTMGNFIGGLVIMLDQPFRIGDWISLPEASGEVEAIGVQSSRLRASSGALLTVPNKLLAEAVVTNETQRSRRRIELDFLIPRAVSNESFLAFREKLENQLLAQPLIQEPLLIVRRELKAEGVGVYLSCYTARDYPSMMEARDQVIQAILETAGKTGLTLTLPWRVLLQEEGERG